MGIKLHPYYQRFEVRIMSFFMAKLPLHYNYSNCIRVIGPKNILQHIQWSLIESIARIYLQSGRHGSEVQGYSCGETMIPEPELED